MNSEANKKSWESLDASDKIKRYLDRQGYPHEFETLRVFRSTGFKAEHSRRLLPDDDGKRREIDVLAYWGDASQWGEGEVVSCSVYYAVECKTSVYNPWIVFCDQNDLSEELYFGNEILTNSLLSKGAQLALFHGCGQLLDGGYLAKLEPTGTNVTTVVKMIKKGNNNSAKTPWKFQKAEEDTACYKALESCVQRARLLNEQRDEKDFVFRKDLITDAHIVIPLVVLKGDLFKVSYDSTKKEMVQSKVAQARVRFAPLGLDREVFIDIVTDKELQAFLEPRLQEAKRLVALMQERCCSISDKILQARDGHHSSFINEWDFSCYTNSKQADLLDQFLKSAASKE